MALHFKTGGDLNEECCTAVFHAAQRKLNSSVKGEAGTCFQQKCLFILDRRSIRKRQQNRSVRQKLTSDAADLAELWYHRGHQLSLQSWETPSPWLQDTSAQDQLLSFLDAIMSVLHRKQFGKPYVIDKIQEKIKKKTKQLELSPKITVKQEM